MSACNKRPPAGHPLHGGLVACHLHAGHDGPCPWNPEPSLARRGIDRLLAVFAAREIESIDSQQSEPLIAYNRATGEPHQIAPRRDAGPWVIVKFIGGCTYGVWKATGDVYRQQPDGTMPEDPIIPAPR